MPFFIPKVLVTTSILLIVTLISVEVSAQSKSQQVKGSIEDSIKASKLKSKLNSESDIDNTRLFGKLAWLYLDSDSDQATYYIDLMLNDSKRQQNDNLLASAYYLKGKSVRSLSNAQALDYFNQASMLLESSNDSILQNLYFEQAKIHILFSEIPEALTFGLKSLEINKIQRVDKNIQRDKSFIGYVYDRMYEFEESIKWNREALKLAKQRNDRQGIALCYGRIGIAFDELAEKDNFNKRLFDSALYYNKKAAKLSSAANDLSMLRRTYSNIGNTYSKLKAYSKAEEYTLKSLKVPGFEESKGVTLVNLGKIYLETNRFKEAKTILDSAVQNTLHYGTRKYLLEAFYRYHELDVKKGDYKNALKNYIHYKTIEDSLLNETKIKQITEVSERYKTADKERQILLQRADLAERDLIIQRQNYQLYGLIGLVLVLALIGYLFYSQQRLKNRQLFKENQLKNALVKIETQNKLQEQRLRISRDLHDNIGAQLTFIISSLDNLKYSYELPESIGQKIKVISDFTSTTIYELRDTIWAMNKDDISMEDLQTRISNVIEKANTSSDQAMFTITIEDTVPRHLKFSSVDGMNIYRIIQEALHNAFKYSEAHSIKVHFATVANVLLISVTDDGIGFDKASGDLGNGLNNMRKRAKDINAKLLIDSKLNEGTMISLEIPMVTNDK